MECPKCKGNLYQLRALRTESPPSDDTSSEWGGSTTSSIFMESEQNLEAFESTHVNHNMKSIGIPHPDKRFLNSTHRKILQETKKAVGYEEKMQDEGSTENFKKAKSFGPMKPMTTADINDINLEMQLSGENHGLQLGEDMSPAGQYTRYYCKACVLTLKKCISCNALGNNMDESSKCGQCVDRRNSLILFDHGVRFDLENRVIFKSGAV